MLETNEQKVPLPVQNYAKAFYSLLKENSALNFYKRSFILKNKLKYQDVENTYQEFISNFILLKGNICLPLIKETTSTTSDKSIITK